MLTKHTASPADVAAYELHVIAATREPAQARDGLAQLPAEVLSRQAVQYEVYPVVSMKTSER